MILKWWLIDMVNIEMCCNNILSVISYSQQTNHTVGQNEMFVIYPNYFQIAIKG